MSDETIIDDELVAYLDGELDEKRSVEVEQFLRERPEARERLAKLQRTWDLLDTLPRPEATNSFTRSTIEMVVDDAKRELRKSKRKGPFWSTVIAAASVVAVLGIGVGYFVVNHYQNQPTRELIQDLDVIENFDKYLVVDDVEFIKLMVDAELFVEEAELAQQKP